jgi:toxin HigB-1
MNVRYVDEGLEELERDASARSKLPPEIVTAFRRRMSQIREAPDERDFYAMRSYNFEKLEGDREGQHSIRLNDQWRLIVQLEGEGALKVIVVIEIVDYH